MLGEPRSNCRNLAIWQQRHNPSSLEIADNRSVAAIASKSPIVNADNGQRISPKRRPRQTRVLGEAAISCINGAAGREDSQYVFPADWGYGHFVGVVRVLNRVCAKAKLGDVTPHVLRHTFASVAGDLGFSELTIAGLVGHSARGVTQGYVHLDSALVVAADRVSVRIAELLGDVASGKHGEKALQRRNAAVFAV
jgi:integrase